MSIQRRGKMVGNPHYTLTSEGYSKAINGALPDEIQEALKTTGIVVLENEETESMMFLVAEELKDSKNIKINEEDLPDLPGEFSGSLEFPGPMPKPDLSTVAPVRTPGGPNPGPISPHEIDPSPTSPHPGKGSSHRWVPGSSGFWTRNSSGVWTWVPPIPGAWEGSTPWYEPWLEWWGWDQGRVSPNGRSGTNHWHNGPNNDAI